METVSIIIPTYNRKNFVKNAVKSGLMQTYPKKEIIVVDDNSDYDIYEALKDFKNKITIIKNKKNMGVSASRNIGIKASSGEYITCLDDDDIFHPKKIERQMKIFEKEKNIGLVYSSAALSTEKGYVYTPLQQENNYYIRLISQNPMGITPLVKRECLLTCGVFDPSLAYHEDRDLWYRIRKKYKFGFDPNPSYISYNNYISRMSLNVEKICSAKKVLYDKHKNDFEDKNSYFSDLHYELAFEYLLVRNYKIFFKHFMESIKRNPSGVTRFLKIFLQKIYPQYQKIEIDEECREIFSG